MSWPVREVTAGTPGVTYLPGMLSVLSIPIPVTAGAPKLVFSKIHQIMHIVYTITYAIRLSHI